MVKATSSTAASVSSTNTLTDQAALPSTSTSTEKQRTYLTQLSSIDREGEEAEREMGDFGGDVPDDRILVPRMTARRDTLKSRGRSSSAGTPGFPELHLTDSAYSLSQQALSRVYSSRLNPVTGEVTVVAEEVVDLNKVQWLANDPENPQNWSSRRKWFITSICAFLTINVTFASTAPTSATLAIAEAFDTSIEISLLGTSLFLFGYCFGPMLFSGLSELVGRRKVFIGTMACYALLQIGEALAPNISALLVIRFLSGLFASAPLTNCGGTIADIHGPVSRGKAMSLFTMSVYVGPSVGPIIGGYLVDSYLGWRWIFWVMLIWALVALAIVVAFLPETYAPVLLAHRAQKMRSEEPEKYRDVYSDLERADFTPMSILRRTVFRPFIMLAKEPILLLTTLYLSVVYGLLYALFSVYPLIWQDIYGFSNGEVGLVFIGVLLGSVIGAGLYIWLQRDYEALCIKWHMHPPPESRLNGAMVAGPILVISTFMLGWTGQYAAIPWWVPAIATIGIGAALVLVFISLLTYTIEVYLMFAASALAANTIVRSAVGGAFPLFTNQMFEKLGIAGALSLIGGIAILITPIPFVFYKYGAAIRSDYSVFAPCLDIHMIETVKREEVEALEKTEGVTV